MSEEVLNELRRAARGERLKTALEELTVILAIERMVDRLCGQGYSIPAVMMTIALSELVRVSVHRGQFLVDLEASRHWAREACFWILEVWEDNRRTDEDAAVALLQQVYKLHPHLHSRWSVLTKGGKRR